MNLLRPLFGDPSTDAPRQATDPGPFLAERVYVDGAHPFALLLRRSGVAIAPERSVIPSSWVAPPEVASKLEPHKPVCCLLWRHRHEVWKREMHVGASLRD